MVKINIENYIETLLDIELFDSFSWAEIKYFFDPTQYKIKKYEKGQIIHIENEVCKSMDIILTGKLSIQKIDEEGKILKVAVFTAGDILGANLLFASKNLYPMMVVAESKLTLLHMSRDLILKLGPEKIQFMNNLLRVVSNKTLVLSDKLDVISLKTIRQRVMDFLKYEYYIQRSNVIELKITKKELAKRLGIQRTSLSRELSKMRSDGLIDFDAKTIRIKNKKFL